MKKIISLSIILSSFIYFLESCEPEKCTLTPRPTLSSVIFSEELVSPAGEVFCERLVSISPQTALNLPLEFTNKQIDGNMAHLIINGLKFHNGSYIPITLPENPTGLKPESLPEVLGQGISLTRTTPIELRNVQFKSAPWDTISK